MGRRGVDGSGGGRRPWDELLQIAFCHFCLKEHTLSYIKALIIKPVVVLVEFVVRVERDLIVIETGDSEQSSSNSPTLSSRASTRKMSQADDEDFGDFNEPEIAPLPEDDTLPSTKHGDPVPQTLSSPRPSAEQNAPATAEPSKSTSAFDDLFDFGPALSVDKNENGGFETRVSESRDNEVLKSGEEHVEESTKREDNEEFGDFGEPEIVEETVEVVGTESSVPDALESTDHVVGADGDAIKEPEASTSQVDDDFGDFATEAEGSGHVEEVATEEPIAQSLEDQPLAAEVAQPPKESELSAPPPTEEEEDDFGDFGEADEAAAADSALAQPEPTPVEPAATPSTPAPRAAVASLDLEGLPELDFATKETIQRTISPLLERLFPDSDLPTATPSSPVPLLIPQSDLSGRTYLTPNPALAGEPWYQLWQTLADKPTYDEATGLPLFMWRRSEVRKNWLKALQVPVNLDDVSFQKEGQDSIGTKASMILD